mgnify:CR=1 FL=1
MRESASLSCGYRPGKPLASRGKDVFDSEIAHAAVMPQRTFPLLAGTTIDRDL